MDREDADGKKFNVHERTLAHCAASPHLRFRRIFEGLCKAVAASGFSFTRTESSRIDKCPLHTLFFNIDYDLQASNGTGVPRMEHCLAALDRALLARIVASPTNR